MKKLTLIGLVALVAINLAFIAIVYPQTKKHRSEFWIYPNSMIDSLKFASVLNGPTFKDVFKSYLDQKQIGEANFEIKAHVKKNDLIVVSLISNSSEKFSEIKKNLQDFTIRYFEETQLKSTNNSDLQIFILNDILNLYKKDTPNYTDQEKNYIDSLGFPGQLLKNTIALRASLYIDSRIFNLDIDSILKALAKLQDTILRNKKQLSLPPPSPLNNTCSALPSPMPDMYFQGLPPTSKVSEVDPALLEKSSQFNYRKAAIELSEDRKVFFERKLRATVKIISDSDVSALYPLKDMVLNLLILNMMSLGALMFFNSFEIRRRQS